MVRKVVAYLRCEVLPGKISLYKVLPLIPNQAAGLLTHSLNIASFLKDRFNQLKVVTPVDKESVRDLLFDHF